MPPLRFDDMLRFSTFCRKLLESNLNIILVAIVNKRGRVIELKTKDGFSSQFGDKDLEMFFMQRALQATMIRDSDCKLGVFNYTITKRENMFEYIAQLDDGLLLVLIDSIQSFSELVSAVDDMNHRFVNSRLDIVAV